MKAIRTIAGLTRAWDAATGRARRLYARRYTLQSALKRNLARFEDLKLIEDKSARYQAFRQIPALEYDLKAVDSSYTASERKSLAQRDRAKHSRAPLTADGGSLELVIRDILKGSGDPWALKAKQYWDPLIDRLRELGLNPTLTNDSRQPELETLWYGRDGLYRHLSPGQFYNIISRVRKRLRSELTASG